MMIRLNLKKLVELGLRSVQILANIVMPIGSLFWGIAIAAIYAAVSNSGSSRS